MDNEYRMLLYIISAFIFHGYIMPSYIIYDFIYNDLKYTFAFRDNEYIMA